ncbi:hypothetical protein GSI_06161 [Ganoderma sinense ZZ0214-1]|uniref:Uncharacterized protein n=1 Tax=Ganoderma sinense ZZ0214-1 TaxID=1077348 RepID=A0A2G8SCH3_9APHY|nr:hypothetical protein GSI_06161 [Ganoderma sinense ZZ0214-1]
MATTNENSPPQNLSPAPAETDTTTSDNTYPPQRHAGAVGYGPEYGKGTGTSDKLQGLKEEFKGKVLRKPELVQHGRDLRTGELKRKEMEADVGLSIVTLCFLIQLMVVFPGRRGSLQHHGQSDGWRPGQTGRRSETTVRDHRSRRDRGGE